MAIKTVRMPGVVVVADPGNGAQIPSLTITTWSAC